LDDKRIGRNHPTFGVGPADQRLGPADPFVAQVVLRLERQPDRAIAQGLVDPRLERELPWRLREPLLAKFLVELAFRLRLGRANEGRADTVDRPAIGIAVEPEMDV